MSLSTPRERLGSALLAVGLLAACSAAPRQEHPAPRRPLRPDSLAENGGDRDADCLHLALDLTLDLDRRSVAGTATSRFRALVDGTRELRLFAVDLEVEEVRDGAGRALEHRLDPPFLRVLLAEPLARGAEASLAVRYRARPERGLYFVDGPGPGGGRAPQVWSQGQEEDARHWIPLWDLPNDRFTYEGRFRVGGGLSVVSNGALVGVEEHGGGERSFTWRMERTLVAYLVAVAAGRWERYEDRHGELALEYYVAPGTGEETARRAFGETPAMLAFFEQLLGQPYPFEKYAQVAVADFPLGGMENSSVTLQNDYVVVDAGAALDLDGDPRLLVAHELAHQWFGDLVTCLGWSHLWLNEAWASWLELVWEREAGGRSSFEAWLERYRERFLARGAEARLPLADDWRTETGDATRTHHEYDKGPWVLHMLARELGEDVFWQAARDYLARHAEGLVTTEDFQRAVFDSTGRNVEGFLEQWVEGGGAPALVARFDLAAARRGEGALRFALEQVQETGELVPLFDLEVLVELRYADGRAARHLVPLDGRRTELDLPLEGPLADLVVDADCGVLCELAVAKPAAMWAAQARHEHAGVRWRAIAPLVGLERGDERAEARVAAEALASLALGDPEPLVRARALELWGGRAPTALLVEAALSDESARARTFAARALSSSRLRPEDRAALRARLELEPSPRARRALEELLAPSRG